MKYLIGLVGSIMTMVVLKLLVDYVFKFTISEFMMGWCCMGYHIARDAYEDLKS